VRSQWRALVEEVGAEVRPAYGTRDAVDAEITSQGGRTAEYLVAQWDAEERPIEALELMRQRTFSASWSVPDEVLEQVHERMLSWARDRYGSLDDPVRWRAGFVISVSWFLS
jgi:hypothetical protein